MLNLPEDVTLYVMKFLDFPDQIKIGRVCSELYELTKHPLLFEELTFVGLGSRVAMTSSQLFNLIVDRLLNVEYVFKIDFVNMQRQEQSITEKDLRFMLVKCKFSKHVRHLKLHTCNEEKTVQVLAKYCPSLRKLEINHMKIESNIFKQVANRCPHITHLFINTLRKDQLGDNSQRQLLDDAMKMYATSNQTFEYLYLSHCHIFEATIRKLLINSQEKKHRLTPISDIEMRERTGHLSYQHEASRFILMKSLTLSSCDLTLKSMKDIGDHGASFIEHLALNWNANLNHNGPLPIPRNLSHLTKLQTLQLIGNKFSQIEKADWKNLKGLTELDLSTNSFSSFPLPVLDITSLKYLNLSTNTIKAVPDEINQLNQLISLDISDNPTLEYLPYDALDEIYSLKELNVNQCPKLVRRKRRAVFQSKLKSFFNL